MAKKQNAQKKKKVQDETKKSYEMEIESIDGQEVFVEHVEPTIYAFKTKCVKPDALKIGYTTRGASVRLQEWKEEYYDIDSEDAYSRSAIVEDSDGCFVMDFAIHEYLEKYAQPPLERAKSDDFKKGVYQSNEFFKGATVELIEKAKADIDKNYHDVFDNVNNSSTPKLYTFYEKDKLPKEEHYYPQERWALRPQQEETVQSFIRRWNAYKKAKEENYDPKPLNLLMYAVMRFGKTFTALLCAEAMRAKFVVVVSAKADVEGEWQENIEKYFTKGKDSDGKELSVEWPFKFIASKDIKRNPSIITQSFKDASEDQEYKGVIAFLTLQNLKNSEKEILEDFFDVSSEADLLIVDETHFGARAEVLGQIIQQQQDELQQSKISDDLKEDLKEEAKLAKSGEELDKIIKRDVTLHLSGTPYQILMSNEFSDEDIICHFQYPDLVRAKEEWDKNNLRSDEKSFSGNDSDVRESDNPYYGFPKMLRFGFNLDNESKKLLSKVKEGGKSFQFSALLATTEKTGKDGKKKKKFVHEEEVLELFQSIDGEEKSEEIFPFLEYIDKKDGVSLFNHIVIVLPRKAACDALETLLVDNQDKFKYLNQYQIINIAGNDAGYYDSQGKKFSLNNNSNKALRNIKNFIRSQENDNKKTLSLTVKKMLTGTTIPQWDSMILLTDMKSPQEYDQAIYRIQNPNVDMYRSKELNLAEKNIENGLNQDQENKKVSNQVVTTKIDKKPQTVLIDFSPERILEIEEKRAFAVSDVASFVDKTKSDSKLDNITKTNEFYQKASPIFLKDEVVNKFVQLTPGKILEKIIHYSRNRGIAEEVQSIPVDIDIAIRNPNILKLLENFNPSKLAGGKKVKDDAHFSDEEINVIEKLERVRQELQQDELSGPNLKQGLKGEEKQGLKSLENRFRVLYQLLGVYSFLTKSEVLTMEDLIESIDPKKGKLFDSAEFKHNVRIAKNLGFGVGDLKPFLSVRNISSSLDFVINRLNRLGHEAWNEKEPLKDIDTALRHFTRMGAAEIITPPDLAKKMVELLPEESFKHVAQGEGVFLDIASKQGEFARALVERFNKLKAEGKLGITEKQYENMLQNAIYSIPTSGEAYEYTRKIYELFGLNIDCIAEKFTSFDLIKGFPKNQNKQVVDFTDQQLDYVSNIKNALSQRKPFSAISLNDSISSKEEKVNFEAIIGNPPYQEEIKGTSDSSIYDKFMEETFKVSNRVELITPARFLFNAGKTPKAWNRKMLNDPHFKVLFFKQRGQDVFPNTDIKGGVAITYRDAKKKFVPIGTFTTHEELNSILQKVRPYILETSLDNLIVQQNKWNLDILYRDHPECRNQIGSLGKEKRLTTSIFNTVDVFKSEKSPGDITILGLVDNKRVFKYIDQKYIDLKHVNLKKFKVLIPKSNGSGAIGEVLSTPLIGAPLIGAPLIGFTQSFIGFGAFDEEDEAIALLKYIKTKFARALLGTLKITQDNNKGTWINVPLQDFTSSSDIDWSQSVAEIDEQLYKKYGLSQGEIDFIETHVKVMD